MPEEKFTRCPGCRTVFRVTPAQLALREGQVRCGHCRMVFDGTANLVNVLRTSPAADMSDEGTGPLTVTLRAAHALEPEGAAGEPAPPASAAPGSARQAAEAHEPLAGQGRRFAWERPRGSRTATAWYGGAAAVLVAALVAQGIWHYRDAIAAHWPSTRPALSRLCALAGCSIRPLRDIGWLSIEASDLQADASHKGLLTLTATLRNRAGYSVDFPHLELTLTDAQDNVVVRRALAPAEYAGRSTDIAGGIAANGEVLVRLFIDASATSQAGYRVYLFYP